MIQNITKDLYTINSIECPCISSSTLGFETQCQTIFDDIQDDDMKLRRVTLPDGTNKIEVVPPSSEEIEERRKLMEERRKRNREYRKYLKESTPEEKYKNKFYSKVSKPNIDGCKNWEGAINSHGYGNVWYNGKVLGAHVVAYILENGEIPKEKWVLHKCDNKRCVNIDHLFLGTRQDNIDDMINKGRDNYSHPGETHGNHKLIWNDINKIREKYTTEKITMDKLSEYYNVSKTNIDDILNNRIWKDSNYTPSIRNNIGENNPISKLTWKQVKEIRELYNNGQYSQNKLAEMFGVHRWTIQNLINNETWKDDNYKPLNRENIDIKYYSKGENHHLSTLTQKQADEIRERYKRGKIRQLDLAKEYGVSRRTIYRIVNNKRYI